MCAQRNDIQASRSDACDRRLHVQTQFNRRVCNESSDTNGPARAANCPGATGRTEMNPPRVRSIAIAPGCPCSSDANTEALPAADAVVKFSSGVWSPEHGSSGVAGPAGTSPGASHDASPQLEPSSPAAVLTQQHRTGPTAKARAINPAMKLLRARMTA